MIVEPLELIVKTAFGESKPGISVDQISDAESRLNLALPEALKDYYAVAGGSREMMDADHHLLAPDKLRVKDNYLIFCEENQWVAEWGVNLDDLVKFPNPGVEMKWSNDQKWFSESSKLSAFLLGLGSWQAVLSVEETVRCELPKEQLMKLKPLFEWIGDDSVRSGGDREGLIDRSNSTLATYLYNSETLYVGATVEGAIEELEERSGLEFEWL